MKMINALSLAEHILATYPNENITPMKLQKLAYYAKVWTLVAGEPLVDAELKKWEFGPVNLDIYYKYKQFGGNCIPHEWATKQIIPTHKDQICSFILNNYVNFSAFELSAMTHNEDPWNKAKINETISDKAIIEFYSKQEFAKNFNKLHSSDTEFHQLINDSWHSFTLDMSEKEAENFKKFSSYEEYLEISKKAENDFQLFFDDVISKS